MNEQDKAKRRKANKIVLSVFGGFILLIVIIVIASGGSSKNKPVASKASTTSPAAMVTAWNNKYGGVFSLISDDDALIADDGGSQNVSKLATDCNQLLTDTNTGQSDPVIPAASVQQHWSSALINLHAAAELCVKGADEQNADLIVQANQDLTQATSDLNSTAAAIKAL